MDVEEYLANITDEKKRAVETNRYRDMGYNVGSDSGMQNMRGILGNNG